MPNFVVRLTITWAVLVVMTLAGFVVASLHRPGIGFAAVMILAGLKARLVARVYMGLHDASVGWQRCFDLMIGFGVLLVAVPNLMGSQA